MQQLRQLGKAGGLALLLLIAPVMVVADEVTLPELLFTEIKVKNDSAGYDEYIEITNTTEKPIDLRGYTLAYYNAPVPADDQLPVEAVVADGLLPADAAVVLAKKPGQIADAYTSPLTSMADSGGLLQLVAADDTVIDEIAWTSTAGQANESVVHVPSNSASQSLHRDYQPQLPVDEEGNTLSWTLGEPEPASSLLIAPPEPEIPDENDDDVPEQPQDGDDEALPGEDDDAEEEAPAEAEQTAERYLPVLINELVPNPAAPATDEDDEYIELYNPNAEPVDLEGYKLQTGNSYSYSFVFTAHSIEPGSYLTVYSSESDLTLANSGGKARLLDPNGVIVNEAEPYGTAKDGLSWSFIGSAWEWTTQQTPNAANKADSPEVKAATAKKSKTKAKKATAKKAAAKKSSKKSGAAERAEYEEPPVVAQDTPIHPSALAVVAGLALLYGAYEYRHDFQNRLYQFRRYRENRRGLRAKPEGRGIN